jgi:hypothetical protein
VPVVEPLTPRVAQNRFTSFNTRHYCRTRFGTGVPDPDSFAHYAIASHGLNNPRSILSQLESDEETEDESVNLGSQDSTRSGELHEYRKDEPDDDEDIVYV